MMGSTCIVRTNVVRKPGLGLGLTGLKNLLLFISLAPLMMMLSGRNDIVQRWSSQT